MNNRLSWEHPMSVREEIITTREVGGIQIPDGTPGIIPANSRVLITQQLGNSFTIIAPNGAMYRIDDRNADALGKEVPLASQVPGAEASGDESLEDRVWGQLKECYDPEIPVNIVALGLVYDVNIGEDMGADGSTVNVKMTLTAPGCGMGPVLAEDVKSRLNQLAGVIDADVEVVFDPPWNPSMMTEAARLQLGFM
jgi:probable FeS assembly SUF system protein SufT